MKLRCAVVGGKKVLVIPAVYEDVFQDGRKYGGMTCTRTARYKCLLIPSMYWDQYREGEEYEVPPTPTSD